jgi:phage terminase Nu1 subunit (DNA packaging protein)
MADASTREKHWRALKAELDYKRAAGELVDAAAIQARIVEIFTTCRTKLLGLPTKAKQRLPHLALADVSALDDVVRESLEELVPERVSS